MIYELYLVECNNDKTLIIELTKAKRRQIHHAGSKAEVLKKLDAWEGCIGIIDEDPEDPQPKKLRSVRLDHVEYDIKVGKYKGNVIVVLCPELEEWVAKVARNTGIRKEINAKDLEDEREFQDVIRELISSNPEPEPIRRLRDILLRGI
jgi:uncharacterized protein (DUF111 family)